MKRFFIAIALFLGAFTSASASDINVSEAALKNFKTVFNGAQEVSWTQSESLYRVQFQLSGQHITAFYDGKGSLVATTRHISSLQLPLSLQFGLRRDYSEYWISDLFEVSGSEGAAYYITLETGDTKLVLKGLPGGEWSVYKREKKS